MNSDVAGVGSPDPDPRRPALLLPPEILAVSAARVSRELASINPSLPAPSGGGYRQNRYDFVLLVVANMISYFYATSGAHSRPQDAILTILVLNTISWIVLHGNIGPLLKRMFNVL
jgi:hypothetical protein